MSEESNTPSGEGEAISVVTADEGSAELTMNHAAKMLAEQRWKRNETPAESADTATAEPESVSQEADAEPAEKQPIGEEPKADPDANPPIEPPSSWTKEAKERWNALPPDTQAYLAEREQQRDREVRRIQNEAAEVRKATEAERAQTEKVRKDYEAKLPALMESLQRQSEFADIRTMDDVRKLQTEDPFRFQQWQIYQMDAQAVDAERRQAEQRQQQEKADARTAYANEQNEKLFELIPEMKDPEKASAIRSKAVDMLVKEYKFTESELGAIMQTDDGFKLLSDARLQKLIADGLAYSELRKAPPKVVPKDLPPVQRPGTSKPSGNVVSERVQALDNKLTNSGSLRAAQELLAQRRAAQRRAS